ncbi:MAG TPA: MFS transporter [Actinomycetes bacterium]|jgi:MFS family permease|nr:MFS transporter [Actinomycetes bacterium]
MGQDVAPAERDSTAAAAAWGGLVPSLPRDAWLILGGDALSAVGSGLTLPFLFVYLTRVRDIDPGVAGLAVATIALAALLGNPLSGWLSDRFGARDTLILGLLVAAAGAGFVALVHTRWQALSAAGVAGFGGALIWPSQDTLLAQVVRPRQRSSVFSVRFATLNAGFGIGALLAAGIVDIQRPGSFVLIYLLDGLTFLVFIPILLLLLRPPPRPGASTAKGHAPGYRQVLGDRVFLRVWALTALLMTIGYGQQISAFPGYATRPGGIAASDLSLAFAANTISVVLGQLFALKLLTGRKRTTGIMLVTVFWAGAWAVTLAAGRLAGGLDATLAFAAAMVVFAVGETFVSPTVTPIVNHLAPDALRGRYNAVSTLAWTTGFVLGPAIGGLAIGAGQPEELFGGLIAACGVVFLGARALERHLPAAANVVGLPAEEAE